MAAPGKNINGPRESMFARVVSHPQGNEVKIPLTGERKLSKETLCSQFPGAIGLKYMHGEHWSAVPILNEYFVLPEDDVQFVVVLNTAGARQILSGSLAGYSSFSFANRVANVMNKEAKSFAPKSNVPYGNRGMLRKQVKQKTPKPFSKTYKDIAEDINSCSNDGTMPTEIFDQQEPSCSSIGKQSSSSLTPAVSLEPAATASTSSDISTSALPFSNVTCPMSPSKETELEDFELVKPKRKRPLRRAAWRFQQTLSSAHSQQQTGLTRQVREENPDTNIIEVMDSEDEELQQVLEESLLSSNDKIPSSVVNIVTLLKTYQGKINKFDKQEIVVFRKRVLDSAFRALKRHSFDVKCKLYVKFSGEIGLDHGGPRREFFRLILLELSLKPSLLTGPDNNKIFTHNLYGLEQNQFGMLGKLVAMSLAQEGPGMGFLNPEVFMLMTGLDPKLQEFDLSLITDIDARSILEELRNLDTVNKVESFLAKHGDWIVDQGVHNVWHLKINDIPMTLHA